MSKPQQPVLYQTPTMINAETLVNDIPDMDTAIAEFNSLPSQEAPWRDVPSLLFAHLNRPDTSKQEPDWELILAYFEKPTATHGRANLQDFYMFITRVALPNIIKANRKHMLSMYMSRKNLPAACRLRYDCVLNTADPFITVPATAITPHIANRPIFRSIMTPNGFHFLQWLRNPPATHYRKTRCPTR